MGSGQGRGPSKEGEEEQRDNARRTKTERTERATEDMRETWKMRERELEGDKGVKKSKQTWPKKERLAGHERAERGEAREDRKLRGTRSGERVRGEQRRGAEGQTAE